MTTPPMVYCGVCACYYIGFHQCGGSYPLSNLPIQPRSMTLHTEGFKVIVRCPVCQTVRDDFTSPCTLCSVRAAARALIEKLDARENNIVPASRGYAVTGPAYVEELRVLRELLGLPSVEVGGATTPKGNE